MKTKRTIGEAYKFFDKEQQSTDKKIKHLYSLVGDYRKEVVNLGTDYESVDDFKSVYEFFDSLHCELAMRKILNHSNEHIANLHSYDWNPKWDSNPSLYTNSNLVLNDADRDKVQKFFISSPPGCLSEQECMASQKFGKLLLKFLFNE
jgi:hypothetical protein